MYIKKSLLLLVLVTETVFYTIGFLMGWKYFIQMVTDQGLFSDDCDESDEVCSSQLEKFDSVYMVSIQSMFTCVLMGWTMDNKGVPFTRSIIMLMTATGFILVSVAHFDCPNALYVAIPLLCTAGYGTFLTNIHTAYTTVSPNMLVVGVLCGAFTSSGLEMFVANTLFFRVEPNLAGIVAFFVIFYNFLQIFRHVLTRESAQPPPTEVSMEEAAVKFETVKISEDDSTAKKSFDINRNQIGLWTNGLRFGIVQFALLMYSNNYMNLTTASNDVIEGAFNQFAYHYSSCFGVLYGVIAGITVDKVLNKLQRPETKFGAVLGVLDLYIIFMPLYHLSLYSFGLSTLLFSFVEDIIKVFLFTTTSAYLLVYFPIERFGTLFGATISVGGLFFLLQSPVRALEKSIGSEYAMFTKMAIFFMSNAHLIYLGWRASKYDKKNKKRMFPGCPECNK